MRQERRNHIEQLKLHVDNLIANREREETSAVLHDALQHVRVWLATNTDQGPPGGAIQRSLITAINTVHPGSVRASVRRHGSWQNLDYYYQLGFEAREIAARHIKAKVDGLAIIIGNLLKNDQLTAAHGILSELLAKANDSVDSLLRKTQLTGQTLYEEALRGDAEFWQHCVEQWGRGGGYRERVAGLSQDWFAGEEQRARLNLVLEFVRSGWKGLTDDLESVMSSVSDGDGE